MTIVRTVEEIQLTMADTEDSAFAFFSQNQTAAQLVPFFTFQADSATVGDLNNTNIRARIDSGSGTVVLNRVGTVGAISATVYLVEFESTVGVQAIDWIYSGGGAPTLDFTMSGASTINDIFFFNTWTSALFGGGNEDDFADARVRTIVSAVNNVTLNRSAIANILEGTMYGIANLGADFSVQHVSSAPLQGATLFDVAISAVTLDQSFVMGSFAGGHTDNDGLGANWTPQLFSTTVARWERGSGGGSAYATSLETQIIELTPAAEGIQRDQFTWGAGTQQSVTSFLGLSDSTIIIPACDFLQNTFDANNSQPHFWLTRQQAINPTTVQVTKGSISTGATGNVQAWIPEIPPVPVVLDMPMVVQVVNTTVEILRIGRLLDILWRERS